MLLKDIISKIKVSHLEGREDIDITGVNIDSRKISNGHLFVAIKGTQVDGHQYIAKAIENGAIAVACEQLPPMLIEGVTYVVTESTENAVGILATVFYGDPSHKLKLVGVTGTNGKTTIAT